MEVVCGFFVLFYGVGSFGGVVNFMFKCFEYKEVYYGGVMVGIDNFYCVEFDVIGLFYVNGMWVEGFKFVYWFIGVYQEWEDYFDYYLEEYWVFLLLFMIQLFKNMMVFFDNEFGNQKQKGVGFQNI